MANVTRWQTGRTIANLIIVVSILLVVGLVIQPILAGPRVNPSCTCQSNLRMLAAAVSLYMGDYDDALPSSYLYGRGNTWKRDDFIRYAKEQGNLNSPYVTAQKSWPMLLYPYLNNSSCLWCPSDRSRSSSPTARVSYYWKAGVDRAWYGDSSVGFFRKGGDFMFPGYQVILYERNSWHYRGCNAGLANGALINCTFLDGHVCTVEVRNSGYTRRQNPAEPLPANGGGEPAWFNYSLGDDNPQFDKGENWDPSVWADRMREIPSGCDDPVVTCQSNLRKLAIAVSVYTGDWDDALPSSYLYGHSSSWNADDFAGFASERGILPVPSGAIQLSWPMVLYPYLTSDRVLWCPSDADRSQEPSARVSYYWKAAFDAAWYGGPDGAGPMTQKQSDYLFPSDQIVLYERNGWHMRGRNMGLADGTIINCAFLDWHVSPKMIRDSGYSRREVPAGPLPENGAGEPAWFNYSYGSATPVFSKGLNWDPRMWGDNLP